MGWTGALLGVSIILLIGGGLAIVAGMGLAIVGPEVVDDENRGEGGNDPLSPLTGSNERAERENANDRQGVRAAGGVVAGVGAVVVLLGGVLYAVARGVQSNQEGEQVQSQEIRIVE